MTDRFPAATGACRGPVRTLIAIRRSVGFAALAATGAAVLMSQTIGAPPSDMEVKAAFVLNFTNFVYWTSLPEEENARDLPICALANSDFADAVRRLVAGKTVGKRSLSFKFNPDPRPARCRVLIVDATEYHLARPALNAIKNAPVLTIGNGPGFSQIGGMFELIVQERKVQFETNLDAIRAANVSVSARLLDLSRNLRKNANGVR